MKEIQDIVRAFDHLGGDSTRTALATVVHVDGSSYRRAGARMLVQDNGQWTGGISGGCLEGDALKKANLAMARDQADVVRYDTTRKDDKQVGVGLGCNGIIDVLVHPIDPEDLHNPIEVLRSCLTDRHLNILLTVITCSDSLKVQPGQMIRYSGPESIQGKFGNSNPNKLLSDIDKAYETRQSIVQDYGDFKVFIEVLPPPIKLVLFGGFYDVVPLLKIGRDIGWVTNVVMNPVKAGKKLSDLAGKIIPKGSPVDTDEYTAFVLMAHDYKTDKENLRYAFTTSVPYIGMLGPVNRRNRTLEELRIEGVKVQNRDMERLHNPIGLDIGASNPEEIAIAIIAEVRSFFSGQSGGYLKLRDGVIHPRT